MPFFLNYREIAFCAHQKRDGDLVFWRCNPRGSPRASPLTNGSNICRNSWSSTTIFTSRETADDKTPNTRSAKSCQEM